jgi:phage terminase large subunit
VLDYGLDMLACYWIATDTQNKAYVYKELYKPNLIISEAAKAILELTTPNENIYQNLGPPDLWNRRQETGKSAAEIFADNGLYLNQTDNRRVLGWYALKEWLAPYQDEQGIVTANLVIFDNCVNLIRCMSQIQRDEKDPNDCANTPHELTHAPDAIRGFVAGRPCATHRPQEPQANPETYRNFNINKSDGGLDIWS